MDKTITEKDYPIHWISILKIPSGSADSSWIQKVRYEFPKIIFYWIFYFYTFIFLVSPSFEMLKWWSILFGVVLCIGIVPNYLTKRSFRYSVGKDSLSIQNGVFQKFITNYQYAEIEHLSISQSRFDRIFNIASLDINDEKNVISGLRKKDAEVLQKLIFEKMKASSTSEVLDLEK